MMIKSCYCYLLVLLHSLWKDSNLFFTWALSSPQNSGNNNQGLTTLSDRFRVACPAPLSSIQLFDPSLVKNESDSSNNNNAVWAAVFRSNQNQPSVFVRDEFLNAMKAAIEPVQAKTSSSLLLETPESKQVPVAVACLRPSTIYGDGCYVLDSLRCVLKKETMDASCDGGSEHCEALAVAIDSLLLRYLTPSSSSSIRFEKAIRAKATLYSGKLLEMRGFEPIPDLCPDMATHVSLLDACLEKYAERSVMSAQNKNNVAKSPGAQQRALSIVSSLARLDREADFQAAAAALARQDPGNNKKDDYDPFSSITRLF